MTKINKEKEFNCPLCPKIVYSEISKGCRLWGMPLDSEYADFCSYDCKQQYLEINSESTLIKIKLKEVKNG